MSAEKLQPGQNVFIEHFEWTTRERKFKDQYTRNKKLGTGVWNPSKSFKGKCIFIDATTGFIDIQFQSSFSTPATIDAVEQFKASARDNGIVVSEYQSDGGSRFTYQEFRKHISRQKKKLINVQDQEVIIKMDEQNILFKSSWKR